MTTLPLAVIGLGRMGRAVEQLAPERGFTVVARLGRGEAISPATLHGAAVAIEFTEPAAATANVRACLEAGCPVVTGTTGWYDELPAIREAVAARRGALLAAPNFSLGVAVFSRLVEEAARRFAGLSSFDAHLVEIHHAAKKDAPSGTAAALARIGGAARGAPIPITSVRTGSVPGTHELIFDAPFEQVRLVHEARDRRVFAEGALTAARWIVGRAGIFTMDDVIASSDLPTSPQR
ncbi:MAG TPA: dihydrodipicolinate reductase C-terminal domain-containing protein [Gemmatimonadaceae bacterium]|nr:dihydrodipicolinate reductase C-terminal domain-containing protein [Gemmatimonadaceae bacterium]